MATGYVSREDSLFNPSPPPKLPTSLFGNPATFTAAANTQASDYDRIMKQYADLLNKNNQNPIRSSTITPQTTGAQLTPAPDNISPTLSPHSQSSDVTGSLSNLSNLATTGGYSSGDVSDIRARDISPIRAIYANAQRNVERQRALQGGYSPNFGALQAKMAREESSQIGDMNTRVNADIAQGIASNKLTAAPSYASSSANANAALTAADQHNADIVNQINEANASRAFDASQSNAQTINQINQANANRTLSADTTNANNLFNSQTANQNNTFGAIQGQTSLYGTTPALTNTFGDQVAQAAQIKQNQQQVNQQALSPVISNASYSSPSDFNIPMNSIRKPNSNTNPNFRY